MNIYVNNCSNTFNYGSMMMGENYITYFNKASGLKNNYFVETSEDINIQRLRTASGIDEIYPVSMNSLFTQELDKYDLLLSELKLKKVVSDFARKMDIVVVLGGDDFTEDYGWKPPLLRGIEFNLIRREGIKVIMLGQTMGPYHSFRVLIMKSLLSKINKIYARDNLTYNYLMNLGLENIALSDDLALLPLAKQNTKERLKVYVTYCPSELIYRYSKDGKRVSWIEFNLYMINVIMNKYPDKKLVLLAHVLKPADADDRIIVNELYGLMKDKYGERIILKNSEMYPYEVRDLIAQSLFVVSSRMHPIISSIQCVVPAIAISYSTKFWGIIGERYGLGEYIIDVRYLDYDEMRNKFVDIMNKIEMEQENIENKMIINNELANVNISNTLEEIKNLK